MKKEKDESYIFSRFVFFVHEVAIFVPKCVHLDKHLACMIGRAFTNGSLGKV